MTISISKIHDKLIETTKEIYSNRFNETDGQLVSFLPFIKNGKAGGIGYNLWFSPKALFAIEELAILAEQFEGRFRGSDIDSLTDLILEALQDSVDSDLFGLDIALKQVSMFDDRCIQDPKEFSAALWDTIYSALMSKHTERLFVYPFARTDVASFMITEETIQLITVKDHSCWEILREEFPQLRHLDLTSGELAGKWRVARNDPDAWLTCKVFGTQDGAAKVAVDKMRQFVSILLATVSLEQGGTFSHCMAQPDTYWCQFPRQQNGESSGTNGLILPPLSKLTVSDKTKQAVITWYQNYKSVDIHFQQRAKVASHFVNYALTTRDLQRFVNLFIALDALFGIKGKSKKTIVEGVTRVDRMESEDKWSEKIQLLYNLRSDIVHADISRKEEWEKYRDYRIDYKTDPFDDIEHMVLSSLRNYFDVVLEL